MDNLNSRQSVECLANLEKRLDQEQEEEEKRRKVQSKPRSARNSKKGKKNQKNSQDDKKRGTGGHLPGQDTRTRDEKLADRKAKKLAKQQAKEARKQAAALKKMNLGTANTQGIKKKQNSKTNQQQMGRERQQSLKLKKEGSESIPRRPPMQFDNPQSYAKFLKKQKLERIEIVSQKQVRLFSHLPQYERGSSLSLQVGFSPTELHPAIIRVGLQYAEGKLQGTNARVVALMHAFIKWIRDFETPKNKVFSLHLSSMAKPVFRFLIDCRPQTITLGNVFRFLKMRMGKVNPTATVATAKKKLIEEINSFIKERIEYAGAVIADYGASKINNKDVVLVYAKSNAVEMIIKKAFDEGKQFRVIVSDARPKLEGKTLLKRLVEHGVKCSYTLINAISYVMKEVTKVFLGAHAVLGNGTVISRVGCALVGMLASTYNIPLMVCCETYKFDTKCKLNAICSNELGDPDELIPTHRDDSKFGDVLEDWRDQNKLKILNIVYDLIPSAFVSMVICEFGMIPVTSVAAILREHHEQMVDIGINQ